MDPFKLVFALAVVYAVSSLLKAWIQSKKVPPVDLTPISERLDRLEALEERIKILETIVTDKNYDLKSQIDNLK